MGTTYEVDDLKSLERILSRLYCHALGLIEHFPRVVLYDPVYLSRMSILSLQTMLTTIWLDYFFFHNRQGTQVGIKVEISLTNLPIET
jgi:hypothetical protein